MTDTIGIYLHIPFCVSKCLYCNFYSKAFKANDLCKYEQALCNEIKLWGGRISRPVSSVYFGGGTPTVMGGKAIAHILATVKSCFEVLPDAEITVEANPADNLADDFKAMAESGVNRISMGVQSVNKAELDMLGRRGTFENAANAVDAAKSAGISNISLDIMLGLPGSNFELLNNSINGILSLNPQHISAYILKLEEGTPLYKAQESLKLLNDDEIAEQYLYLCAKLEQNGFEHYEISNFAKPGFTAKHNTAYWQCREYLGIGPTAHSFLNGKRFYYTPGIYDFGGGNITDDGPGGTAEEFIMLSLRLNTGLNIKEFEKRFGNPLPESILLKAEEYEKHGLCTVKDSIVLTNKGMLVSNSIISSFLEELNENL